jgi:hypothetical protein
LSRPSYSATIARGRRRRPSASSLSASERGSSFGQELRRERELREIGLREVAEATKINLRYLEALERDDFGHLPEEVYVRGFVRAYCQHIGVDAEAMVNALILQRQRAAGGAADENGMLRGSRTASPPAARARPADAERGSRGLARFWVWLVVALVLAGSAYVVLRLVDPTGGASEAPLLEQTRETACMRAPGVAACDDARGGQRESV